MPARPVIPKRFIFCIPAQSRTKSRRQKRREREPCALTSSASLLFSSRRENRPAHTVLTDTCSSSFPATGRNRGARPTAPDAPPPTAPPAAPLARPVSSPPSKPPTTAPPTALAAGSGGGGGG